jgi:hypothetical protein
MSNFDKHVAFLAADKFQKDPALQGTIKTLQDFEAYVAAFGENLNDAEKAQITALVAAEEGSLSKAAPKAKKAPSKKAIKAVLEETVAAEVAKLDAAAAVVPVAEPVVALPAPAEVQTVVPVMDAEKAGLTANSCLMRLGFAVMGNSKRAYIDAKTDAEQSRFKIHKTLLNSPELKAISKADMKIRQFVYKESIPFDMGSVLLAYTKVDFVTGVLENYKNVERPALVAELIARYPERVDEAKAELKAEFEPKHFPDVKEIAGFFSFDYKLMGFDVPGELASINKAAYQAQVEKAKAQIANVTHEIQQAQRTILFSLVDNLAFKLMPDDNGKARVINPGAVTKLQKFITDFSFNNVTGDSEATKLIAQLKALTEGASPETFKSDAEMKAATAAKLISIQDSLEGLIDVKPERKYKDLEDDGDVA